MIGLLLAGCLIPFLRTPAWVLTPRPEAASLTFYEREDARQEASSKPVTVLVVGDILLGRGVSLQDGPFQPTSGLLGAADITVGNFEGALAGAEGSSAPAASASAGPPYRLVADPGAVRELQQAGFDLVSLANNHSLDEGEEGLRRIVFSLRGAGIHVVGAGNSLEAAFQPAIISIGEMRIAFLAMNGIPYPGYGGERDRNAWHTADWDLERMQESIAIARREADAVLVIVHWGDEYEPHAGPYQRRLAHALVEMGADAVIGSHTHTLQETEVYVSQKRPDRPGFIAYGLGNFVFDQYDERTRYGQALSLEFDQGGLAAVRSMLVNAGPQPEWVQAETAKPVLDKLRPGPERLAFECRQTSCLAVEAAGGGFDGIFREGSVDLSGDGFPETVIRRGDRIQIYEKDVLVWESEADWKVLDAALGDPNDDGRAEVLLALQKPDPDGAMRSHPFVIGYRGGVYRQVWGGSAVKQPILEVELSDLDGDGRQELVVLEVRDGGLRGISVWRWNDWIFSKMWSSQADQLTGLGIVEKSGANPQIQTGRIW
jgi:poly-gamma-glutamate synthesis protein (capsule biosynthesis protein)